MLIDLDTLNPKNHVQESQFSAYTPLTGSTPMKFSTKVQKAANRPKQPLKKSAPIQRDIKQKSKGPTVATSPKTTSEDLEKLLAEINSLKAKFCVSKSQYVASPDMNESLDQSRRDAEAATYNSGRSAVQRADFLFKAATSTSSTVAMGKSAHAVRMNGNVSAPAPSVVRMTDDRRTWFNDSYMQRLGGK